MRSSTRQLSLFADDEPADAVSGFSVRQSARAKRLSIRVFPRGRVEVVVPGNTRASDVRQFVESQREWIARTRAGFAAEHPPEAFALPHKVSLPAVGREFEVCYRPAADKTAVSYRMAGQYQVILSGGVQDESVCVQALRRWLAGLARKAYRPQLDRLAADTGLSYRRLQVRGQRSCWGSHSSRGTISLNYCLLFLAPQQLRYVMLHELCHARHMNHSRRFWRLLGSFEPDYRRLDKSLNSAWQEIPVWVGIY